jgi:hypothetical protein
VSHAGDKVTMHCYFGAILGEQTTMTTVYKIGHYIWPRITAMAPFPSTSAVIQKWYIPILFPKLETPIQNMQLLQVQISSNVPLIRPKILLLVCYTLLYHSRRRPIHLKDPLMLRQPNLTPSPPLPLWI